MPAHTPGPGEVVRIRSARWKVSRQTTYEDATLIEVLGCDRDNQGEHARFLLPFEPFARVPLSPVPAAVSPGRWRRVARAAVAAASPTPASLDTAAAANFHLLPFQLEPALAVARGAAARVLVADDVGLGKTVQAGLLVSEVLHRRHSDGRAIIVCPAGLREQWCAELRDRFRLEPVVLDSAAIAASPVASAGANPWAAHEVVIASVDFVKRPEVMRSLEGLIWDVAVFDEAHALSGRSDRAAAASALADRARVVVMLTATPHSGDEEAFARLGRIGSLDGTFPLVTFRRARQDVGPLIPRRTRWTRVHTTAGEARMHRGLEDYARMVWRDQPRSSHGARLAMAVLMRRACSSAASLARSLERRLTLLGRSPDEEQLALPFSMAETDDEPSWQLGAPGLSDGEEERTVLEGLHRVATDAAVEESKVWFLRRFLRRAREPAIVFTEYRDTLVHLDQALADFRPVLLHGGLTTPERRDVIRRFTSGDVTLLLATDAASEGLNLHQHCRLVINLEVPWSPTRLEQRIGRVERIGQRRRVHAVHVVAAGTGEDTTVATLCARMQRVRHALAALAGRGADEGRIVQSILEGADLPLAAVPGPMPPPAGVVTLDLREAAATEAGRIAGWRQMAAAQAATPPVRPAVAVLRRAPPPARCCWAFRTEYVDARGHRAYEMLRGIDTIALQLPLHTASSVRRWFGEGWEGLRGLLHEREHADAAALAATMREPLVTATDRERAILSAIDVRRARMAASLIQAGLFDARNERAAAAQTAILQDAAARCERRLVELDAMREIGVAGHVLVFAAILG